MLWLVTSSAVPSVSLSSRRPVRTRSATSGSSEAVGSSSTINRGRCNDAFTTPIKVFCPRDNPSVPSVADLWPAADWHEREAYDMFGIVFDGHPDLRRILCADDWEGFPLRKDYVFPREYHGIPASVELDWQQQPDYPK